jgi:3-dehydroquinate synthetase
MTRDKKVEAGKIRFVLLERFGRAVLRDDVPRDLLERTVAALARG